MVKNVTFYGVSMDKKTCVLTDIRFENTHEPGDTFTTTKLGACEVEYKGVRMTPNVFERRHLKRTAGKWVASIKAQRSGQKDAVTFKQWFEEDVLGVPPIKRRRTDATKRPAFTRGVATRPVGPRPVAAEFPEPLEDDEMLRGDALDSLLAEFDEPPAAESVHPPAALETPHPPSSAGRRVGRVRVTVRNVPADSRFFRYFDGGRAHPPAGGAPNFDDVLFAPADPADPADPAPARVVGYRAVCPVVAAFTLYQFFHAHTSARMLCGTDPPPVLYSDRFRFLFDDPLVRGKVFAFDEHVADGVSRTRCYLYDGELAEFVKFCGFSGAGEYVGFSASTVSACADRLESRAAAENYRTQAERCKEAYEEGWASVVGNVRPEPDVSPASESPRRNVSPAFTAEDPNARAARKKNWFESVDKLPGSRYAPRPEKGAVTDHVWSLFCDACWSMTARFSDAFTFSAVVASLKAELGKEMTFQQRCEVADCMTWCAVQGGRLPA